MESEFASQAEMQKDLANAVGSEFKALDALTNATLPSFSSGMDAALQNMAVKAQNALQP